MKSTLILFLMTLSLGLSAQPQPAIPPSSILSGLVAGDSIVYYQCHVKDHHREVNLPDRSITTNGIEKYSLTEKFVIYKSVSGYRVTRYLSPLVPFPNRRFSGLKITERPYWNFIKESTKPLSEKELAFLIALERRGREAIEFDYAITRYTTNQLIIKHNKDFRQLVIDDNTIIANHLQ